MAAVWDCAEFVGCFKIEIGYFEEPAAPFFESVRGPLARFCTLICCAAFYSEAEITGSPSPSLLISIFVFC